MAINPKNAREEAEAMLQWPDLTIPANINGSIFNIDLDGPFSWTGNSGQSAVVKYSFDSS